MRWVCFYFRNGTKTGYNSGVVPVQHITFIWDCIDVNTFLNRWTDGQTAKQAHQKSLDTLPIEQSKIRKTHAIIRFDIAWLEEDKKSSKRVLNYVTRPTCEFFQQYSLW